ncbi:MAG: sulfite exporter TauE/SafE family protein [Micromonosporaceae bacterium]
MNLGAVLVTGLFAGGVSCAAIQGGLLTGLVARQRGEPTGPGRGRGGGKVAGRASRAGGKAVARAAVHGARHGTTAKGKTVTAVADRPAKQTRHAARRSRNAPPPRTFGQRLADDLAPVGGFLAGKLVSHTLLGLMLGALGSAVQLSPRFTALTQIAAGLLIVAFGLAQLGAPGFRNFTIEPPASCLRFVRGRARSQSALAPAMLGAATILVPCGVTLSVMALAVTSGSPLRGAAVMAVFVIGTSPLFAALGYLARKAATSWQGRLATITGLIVLLLGLYTLNTGLVRADSPVTGKTLAQAVGLISEPPTDETVTLAADGNQEVVLTATTGSYSPGNLAVKAGVPTTLIVRAENAQGCVRAFVIPDLGRQWVLPENGDTRIDLGELKPGTMDFTCSMGMYSGVLTIT